MAAVRQREDVIQQQARLLEEANRKLDQNLNHNPKQVEQNMNPKQVEQNINPKQVEHNMNHNPKQVEPAVRSKQAVLQPLNMIEKEPDFHKPAMAIHTTPNAQNSSMTQQEIRKSFTSSNIPNGQLDNLNKQEVKRPTAAPNDFQKSGFRFDALKTPSYFLGKASTLEKSDNFGSTNSEKTDSSPESSSDHENTDQEKLRKKRLAFFERNLIESVKITPTLDSIKISPTAMLVREVESTKREIPEAKIICKSSTTSNFNFESIKSQKNNLLDYQGPPIFNTQKRDKTDVALQSKQADIISLTQDRKTEVVL